MHDKKQVAFGIETCMKNWAFAGLEDKPTRLYIHGILLRRPKRPLVGPRIKQEDDINIYLRGTGCEDWGE
jgi:hypothetical protein